MNRREALKAGVAGAALAALAPSFLLGGCTFSAKGLLNAAIDAALAVLKVAEPGAAWVTEFSAAVTALENAEKSWTAGGAATIVVDALNTLEAITAAIPFTAVYSPLIDVLVAGIEAVMAAMGWTTTATARRYLAADGRSYPHKKRTSLAEPHFLQTKIGAFKQQWNQVADGLQLTAAKI